MENGKLHVKTNRSYKTHIGADSISVPNGITLVALVITVIILLILAGITISLTIGQRGILNRAQEAGKNYQEAAKKEDEQLNNFLKETDKIINEIQENKELSENALAKKVEIGDYVAYDPTQGVTDTSKLSYTSEIGTGMEHGNGHSKQTFIATNEIKWRVLSKDEKTGEVVLISELPIQAQANTNFYLKSAIGYLYAEQELNEICKIYGYGKGANTNKTFEYETGDFVEGIEKGSITGSGARSITIEDINKITKYDPSTYTHDYDEKTYKYGDENTHTIYYPTKTRPNGASTSATKRKDKWTSYMYQGSQYLTDTTSAIYQMLFGSSDNLVYWIASRGVISRTAIAQFPVFAIGGGGVVNLGLCMGLLDSFHESDDIVGMAVRPIVYLKPNIQTTTKDTSGAWIISE